MNRLVEIIDEDAARVCQRVNFNEIAGKTILISGASGLVGIHLMACLKQLAEQGQGPAKVIALIQSPVSVHLQAFYRFPGADVIQGDLTQADFLCQVPEADYIIHAAGYGQPGRFMENKIKTIQLNTLATMELFKKLKTGGKFLFISTSEVYSGLTKPPHHETEIGTTNTTHPRACYIEGKRCGEAICNAFRSQGIEAKSARLALAYGPGTKPGDMRVINAFIERALQGKITLMDQGQAKRTYCYVADAVEIMWQILFLGKNPIYNIGGFERITIAELAQQIGHYLDVPVVFPEATEQLAGAPDDVRLDMSSVEKEFQKNDYVSFNEGLVRTIEWQKALYVRE